MDLNHIKEFVLLANINNFQEAADSLYISQSTLSRHIQSLEKELQNKLFERTTRTVRLNEFGKFFLPYAQEMVCIEQDFYNEFYQIHKQVYEVIRVSTIPAMAPYHFTDVLARFQKEHPNYRLEITEITALDSLYEDLLRNVIDFALIHEPEAMDQRLQKMPFVHDWLAAAVPESHPLAKRKTVSLLQLKNETFLTMPLNSIVSRNFLSACKRNGFSPSIAYSGHKEDVLLSLVQNSFGIGILSRITAEYTRHEQICLLDIVPKIPTSLSLVYRKDMRKTTGKTEFLKCCQEVSDFYFPKAR